MGLYLVQLYNPPSSDPRDRHTILVSAQDDPHAVHEAHHQANLLNSKINSFKEYSGENGWTSLSVKSIVKIEVGQVVQMFTLSSEDTVEGKLIRFYD